MSCGRQNEKSPFEASNDPSWWCSRMKIDKFSNVPYPTLDIYMKSLEYIFIWLTAHFGWICWAGEIIWDNMANKFELEPGKFSQKLRKSKWGRLDSRLKLVIRNTKHGVVQNVEKVFMFLHLGPYLGKPYVQDAVNKYTPSNRSTLVHKDTLTPIPCNNYVEMVSIFHRKMFFRRKKIENEKKENKIKFQKRIRCDRETLAIHSLSGLYQCAVPHPEQEHDRRR